MVATTDQKARLLDLTTGVLELVRDGKRNANEVCDVLQFIKEERDFASILRPDQKSSVQFKIWKTVKLGLRRSAEEYRSAIASKRQISIYAGQIFDKIPISQEAVEVDLVLVDGYQLGCKSATRRDAIYKAAFKFGLEKCPAEVGLVLAEQYDDQPADGWIFIGMDPIAGSGGGPSVFGVARGGSARWLLGSSGGPGGVWGPDDLWAFVRPRK